MSLRSMSLALVLPVLVLAACGGGTKPAATSDAAAAPPVQPAAAPASVQAPTPLESVQSAAPKALVDGATIMAPPEKSGGEMTPVRQGTNGWLCVAASATMDPVCADKSFAELMSALKSKEDPQVKTVGFAYMLHGDAVGASNTDPYATAPTADNQWVKAPAHIMVVLPDPRSLDAFPTDPRGGGPWVMWRGTKYAHLMVPVR